MRFVVLTLGWLALAPTQALAEWQVKPFLGVTGGGSSTFLLTNPENPASVVFGANGGWLGEIVGFEGDFGYSPAFFHEGASPGLITGSGVMTVTGNAVIAMPKHLTDYTLRLYFVGGAGMIHVNVEGSSGGLVASETLAGMDLGGGATGFLTKRVGLNWDVRHFRSLAAIDLRNSGTEPGRFSFWRVTMAVAIRY
jgi:hypothetical protein